MPNSPVCVDASFVLRLVIPDDLTPEVGQHWVRWKEREQRILAPSLLLFEVTNALYQYVRHEVLRLERAHEALTVIRSCGITFSGDENLHAQALSLARRFSLPAAYDAHYLALAQIEGAELWTADRRLARVVQAELPWLRLLGRE